MKGFKKDGKFIPTERNSKNSLKKKDLYKKSISSPSGGGHEMRAKKTLHNTIDFDTKNFGLDVVDGQIERIRLGNWSDAGWHWSLQGDDARDHANTYLIRIADNEDEAKEFVELAKKQGLDYELFKKQILKNLTGELKDDEKSDDGIFAISGDNGVWNFGEEQQNAWEGIDESFFDGSVDYTEEEQELVLEEAYSIEKPYTYSDFLSDYGSGLRTDLINKLEISDSFEEYFDQIGHDYGIEYVGDDLREALNNHIFSTIAEASNKLQKEGKLRKEAGQQT